VTTGRGRRADSEGTERFEIPLILARTEGSADEFDDETTLLLLVIIAT